ncbi:MAG: fused MFS/spermidine synthase, partial [Planctomycetia bacterium]
LVRQLILDALIHGYVDMQDHKYLHYEYEHLYASVSHRLLRAHQKKNEPLRVLFLGGGSFTFPRYLSAYYPDLKCDVGEIDPRVSRAVRLSMGLNKAAQKRIVVLGPGTTNEESAEPPTPSAKDRNNLSFLERLGRAAAITTHVPTTPAEIRKVYTDRVVQAGAVLEDEVEAGVDYLLDLRTDKAAASPIADKAKELKIEMIDAAAFDALLAEESHPNIETHHRDARQYIMQNTRLGEYDVVYGDAFNDFSVPSHLTTVEFNREMAKLLKPDGIFMANVIDIYHVSKFMGAYFNTLKQVFNHVYLLSTEEGEPNENRSTFVIICSQKPVELHDLGKREEDVKGLVGTLIEGDLMKPVLRGGLKPTGTAVFPADGNTTTFKLPRKTFQAGVSVRERYEFVSKPSDDDVKKDENAKPMPTYKYRNRILTESGFKFENQDTVVLNIPPRAGHVVTVTLYGEEEIVLTDEKCPVDNMLSEVIATRAK